MKDLLLKYEKGYNHLRAGNYSQLDPDGIMVSVSREALEDTISYAQELLLEVESLEYKLKRVADNTDCIKPDCDCLDYCEADDPYSETPIRKGRS